MYSGRAVVDRVNMHIKKGDVYGLIGENGAGKTTLIRLITSLVRPDEGEIELFGEKEEKQLAWARSRTGSIVDTPALYPGLTAVQNLEYYRLQWGIPDQKCVRRALELVGLGESEQQKYSHFSPGMKQRLGLALAILNDPDFILLDEPNNSLDPLGTVEIRSALKHLNEDLGITVLISSHLLSELYLLATTYGVIHNGRLVKEFNKEQLDEKCKRCLHITVDDIRAAAIILETVLETTNYQVVGGNEIRLYDYLEEPAEVNYQLSMAHVRVSSIYEIGVNLEDYFRAVITEAG
jgi:ABC-2 type transport system ATP-binding protein